LSLCIKPMPQWPIQALMATDLQRSAALGRMGTQADATPSSPGFAQTIVFGALATLALVRLGIACGASRFGLGTGAILCILAVVAFASRD